MENAQPSRLPAGLLIVVMCLVGICALPSAVMFMVMGIAGGTEGLSNLTAEQLGTVPMLVAPLFAYPVAVWLWLRARRPRSTGRAWLHAAVGILLITGTAYAPVTIIGSTLIEEWQETQPGGRGYEPPGVR
jgi:hypothetical protein